MAQTVKHLFAMLETWVRGLVPPSHNGALFFIIFGLIQAKNVEKEMTTHTQCFQAGGAHPSLGVQGFVLGVGHIGT